MAISTINQNGLNAPLTLTAPILGTPASINLTNAVFPAGCVIQVVQATTTTSTSTSLNTFVDTTLSGSITPKFATSKILIFINHTETYKTYQNASSDCGFNLCRNGSQIVQFNNQLGYTGSAVGIIFSTSFTYLDSPATTSAVTYKTQFKNSDVAAASIIAQQNSTTSPSVLTFMEIAQ